MYYEDQYKNQFTEAGEHIEYWLTKFPRLLNHTFHTFAMFRSHDVVPCGYPSHYNEKFRKFFNSSFTFKKPDYFKDDIEQIVKQQIGKTKRYHFYQLLIQFIFFLDPYLFLESSIEIDREDIISNKKSKIYGAILKKYERRRDIKVVIKTIEIDSFRRVEVVNLCKVSDNENIVKCFGYLKLNHCLGIVLERAQCNLEDYLDESKSESLIRGTGAEISKREILLHITRGLQYLHKKEIVHCDLKPDNILIIRSDKAKVVISDFGSSKNIEGRGSFTMTKSVEGTSVGLENISLNLT